MNKDILEAFGLQARSPVGPFPPTVTVDPLDETICIDTPQVRGWLTQRLPAGDREAFAQAMAAATALEFCLADAAILAAMYVRHPGRGFALHPDGLPLLLPARHVETAPAFPALTQRQMGLYAVVDSAEALEQVLEAGVRTVQLRIKQGAPQLLADAVRRSVRAARAAQAQLFINDHWQLAIEHGAYGVHLGQEDLGAEGALALPALRSAGLRLGLSTHSLWEVCRARACKPSYIACGPIHATVTKDMPWLPQGEGNLRYWCQVLPEPVVAIAGMDFERSRGAASCGAAGVAVLRGLAQTEAMGETVRRYQAAIAQGEATARPPAPALPRTTLRPAAYPGAPA